MIEACETAGKGTESGLPRLLLVSEMTLTTTRAEVPANPTLLNLFSGYPPDSLFSMAPAGLPRPQSPFDRLYLGFSTVFLPRPSRGRRFIDPILLPLEWQILDALLLSAPEPSSVVRPGRGARLAVHAGRACGRAAAGPGP